VSNVVCEQHVRRMLVGQRLEQAAHPGRIVHLVIVASFVVPVMISHLLMVVLHSGAM
jgi:hypothetical protein